MKIKIRSKNFEITPAIFNYVNKKVSSLAKFLHLRDDALSEVEIGRTTTHHKSGDIFRAEINISEPGAKQIHVAAEEADLYTAIDVVRDETERAIVSRKNKYRTMFRRGAIGVKNILKRIDPRNFRRK
ncbi:MAG TPA: ribosome-associated translation inhibitor RaiA [Candidatus Paceibacterota bacterium]